MIKKIGLVACLALLGLLGYVGMTPPEYTVSRSITIHAPAAKIFPYLNHSKLAAEWGPWIEIDPKAPMHYSGPDQGVGSKTSWSSETQLGTGSATIVESVAHEKVRIKIEYTQPMTMTQDSWYLIETNGSESTVTWKVEGKNSFIGRLMCMLFMNMDKVVGSMFEKGLTQLKTIVEKTKHKENATYQHHPSRISSPLDIKTMTTV